jgi:hypothetical protein
VTDAGADLDETVDEVLPAVDFSTFVLSLAHSALVHLGVAPDPATGQQHPPSLPLARQTIDLVSLLAEKTKGNLNGEEERLIEQLLYDLRLHYVEASKGGVEARKGGVEASKGGT